MLNVLVLMGRLVRDPELKKTSSDISVTTFTVAVDRDIQGKDGERQTDFIDCVAWRSTADFIYNWFHKGDMVAVTGRLQLRDWTDRDGNKRRSAECIADKASFCGGKSSGKSPEEKKAEAQSYVDAGLDDADGELPF